MKQTHIHFLVILLLASSGVLRARSRTTVDASSGAAKLWAVRTDSAQTALDKDFWFSFADIYYSTSARGETRNYWWQAHALDALVMGYRRTGSSFYTGRMIALYQGILSSGGFTDDYYDDMEWMALALLRAYEATQKQVYLNETNSLWQTIKGGWSDTPGGGGIQWRTAGIYKNVPANAPACILACKLYEDFGDTANLTWARKIHSWIRSNLVDTTTGVILDGITYNDTVASVNHGSYSYNYGTYLGASLYLYQISGDTSYLDEAVREAGVADSIFAPTGGILKSEGTGDGGLFKGIYVYYLARLIREPSLSDSLRARYEVFLLNNAESLWSSAQQPGTALFNDSWQQPPSGSVTLSEDLSGVTLLESVAAVFGDSAIMEVRPEGSIVPRTFYLYQNYPNPFNPSIEIKVTLDKTGVMSLKVYNVLGQVVEVIAQGYKPVGEYTYNVNMNRFASGVYFYSLRQGSDVLTNKMLLLK